MPKAVRDSKRVAVRSRAPAKSNHCPVASIAAQIEGLWLEHDRTENLPDEQMTKSDREVLMRELFDASETLKDLASITRARSLVAALFQIGLAHDCAMDLRNNKTIEDRQIEIADQMARLLYSAAGVMRRELLATDRDLSTRYMPVSNDPLTIFEKARAA